MTVTTLVATMLVTTVLVALCGGIVDGSAVMQSVLNVAGSAA